MWFQVTCYELRCDVCLVKYGVLTEGLYDTERQMDEAYNDGWIVDKSDGSALCPAHVGEV